MIFTALLYIDSKEWQVSDGVLKIFILVYHCYPGVN